MSVKPYTYIVGWKSAGLWYYGVRYANKTPARDDLWSKYFTSSKRVKECRQHNGEPDVIIVHREFVAKEDAIEFERNFLKTANAVESPFWLNAIIPDAGFVNKTCSSQTKRKISEMSVIRERFLHDKPKMKSEMKLLREQWKKESLAQYWSSAKAIDHKETISAIHTGKIVGEETKKKQSEKAKVRESRVLTCPHCGKTGKGRVMFRWHFDACSKK